MNGEAKIAAQVAEAVESAKSKAPEQAGAPQAARSGRKKRTSPFRVSDGYLSRKVETEGADGEKRERWVKFGSEINILARTRTADGKEHGRLIEVVDCDGVRHIWAMPASLMAGSGEPIRAELMSLGFEPVPGAGRKWRDWLLEYLLTEIPDARARCVSRIGWHGPAYVLPDETISAEENNEQIILQTAAPIDHAFNTAGTLEEWQQTVASLAVGNSRLLFAISAAFAAPLLALTGDDSIGFHFRGGSSTGKSTILTTAGSVWGGGDVRDYVQSWRSTDNALEGMAAMHDGACLCLDELAQIEPKAAGAAAYMLGNGIGKARAGREGQARKSLEWRLVFVSSGEIGLSDKIREGGGRIAAGMEVRVIDIRADANAGLGAFEALHDSESPAIFSQRLKSAARKSYGHPARAFLGCIVKDIPQVRDGVSELRANFTKRAVPEAADGQVRRVADRFALVATAGELATSFGITGWPEGIAAEAAMRCFVDWVSERGGVGSSEVASAIAAIRRAIEVDGHARFLPWRPDNRTVIRTNALGYVQRAQDDEPETQPIFFLHNSGIEELLAGLDRKAVLDGLADAGVIVRQEVTSKGNKVLALNKTFKVPSEGRPVRLYQLDISALTGTKGDDDG